MAELPVRPAISFTSRQKRAFKLLARGGARYGTMHTEMSELRVMGYAYAHDNGRSGPGRWTWRPVNRDQARRLSET